MLRYKQVLTKEKALENNEIKNKKYLDTKKQRISDRVAPRRYEARSGTEVLSCVGKVSVVAQNAVAQAQ